MNDSVWPSKLAPCPPRRQLSRRLQLDSQVQRLLPCQAAGPEAFIAVECLQADATGPPPPADAGGALADLPVGELTCQWLHIARQLSPLALAEQDPELHGLRSSAALLSTGSLRSPRASKGRACLMQQQSPLRLQDRSRGRLRRLYRPAGPLTCTAHTVRGPS